MCGGLVLNETLKNERLKRVTAEWSHPRQLEKNWYNELLWDNGLYYISRKFGSTETFLYIGQTSVAYVDRLSDHDWNWLHKYRGKKYFRLGTIIYPTRKTKDDMKQLIIDVESALIYETQPLNNEKAKKSYNPKHLYIIENTGKRGELPRKVSMRNHIIE